VGSNDGVIELCFLRLINVLISDDTMMTRFGVWFSASDCFLFCAPRWGNSKLNSAPSILTHVQLVHSSSLPERTTSTDKETHQFLIPYTTNMRGLFIVALLAVIALTSVSSIEINFGLLDWLGWRCRLRVDGWIDDGADASMFCWLDGRQTLAEWRWEQNQQK